LANITTDKAGSTIPENIPSYCCEAMPDQYKQLCKKDGCTMPDFKVKHKGVMALIS
jgi:hypothetical protein